MFHPPKKTILWINDSDLTATPLEMMVVMKAHLPNQRLQCLQLVAEVLPKKSRPELVTNIYGARVRMTGMYIWTDIKVQKPSLCWYICNPPIETVFPG